MLILKELHPDYEQVSSIPQGCDEMSTLVEEYISLPSQTCSLTDPTLSIYTTAPCKFIVDGKALYIHSQLVSRYSKPLSDKINAKKDFTIIEGVDKDTFVRFIEWAYKGYYNAAEYRIDAESPSLSKFEDSDTCTLEAGPCAYDVDTQDRPIAEPAAAEEPAIPFEEPDNGWGSFGTKKSKKAGKKAYMMFDENCYSPPEPPAMISSKNSLKQCFYDRKYEIRQDTITIPPPRPNQEPNENYTAVFLSHAHLYAFARNYDIPSLKTLALENLHLALDRFTLHPERTGDIIELLRYIYSSRELKEGAGEDMREMLRGYIGFQMDVLMKDRDFRGLMKEEEELLDDFVEMVGKRIE